MALALGISTVELAAWELLYWLGILSIGPIRLPQSALRLVAFNIVIVLSIQFAERLWLKLREHRQRAA